MPLPPRLQNLSAHLQPLRERFLRLPRKQQIAAGGGAALLFVVLLIILFSGGEQKPTPQPLTPPPQEAPKPQASPDQSALILQLFNPSNQSLENQLSTTVFTQQIEQAMTVSFVLIKCQLISQDDYTDTFRALILYAQQTKLATDPTSAEALVREIANASGASYQMIYSRTPCSDPTLRPLAKQLMDWVDAVFKR